MGEQKADQLRSEGAFVLMLMLSMIDRESRVIESPKHLPKGCLKTERFIHFLIQWLLHRKNLP